jgi:hypothetical protein
MHTNRMDNGWQQTARGGRRRLAPAAVLVVAVWGLGGWNTGAVAGDVLRWTFKEGETLRFSLDQKMVMSTKGMGVEYKSLRTSNQEFTWKVLSVGADGEAEITHRIERVRMRAEEPRLRPFEFDSATIKEAQPGFESETRALRAEVGAEFTFKMKPNGEIVDIKIPEGTLKRFRDAMPAGAQGPEISEKSLKDLLVERSAPAFPTGALDPGKTWTSKPEKTPLSLPGPNPPFATLILGRTFTYQGPDSKSPNLLLVAIDKTAKIEPVDGLDVKVDIRRQEGTGSMTIDSQTGRVVSTRDGMKLDITVKSATGQVIEQSSDTSSSMTLQQ